jgi:nicotinic acid mononucleotide adenylyltransferase
MIGCFPGSFNPATIAHIAVAAAALEQCGLSRLDLIISEAALGKLGAGQPSAQIRARQCQGIVDGHPLLRDRCQIVVSELQLLADIAEPYDWVVMGADKWLQIAELRWYDGQTSARDLALSRLPAIAVSPRNPTGSADSSPLKNHPSRSHGHFQVLQVAPHLAEVSSTEVRAGRRLDWSAGQPSTDQSNSSD